MSSDAPPPPSAAASPRPTIIVHSVDSSSDPLMPAMRQLIRDLITELDIDMKYQAVEEELALLPGKYSRQCGGCMLIAVDESTEGPTRAMGCVMLRPLEPPAVGEVKRMFVSRDCRRFGVARLLMQRLLVESRALGYSTLRLDTLERLKAANALYKGLGFYSIPAYCYNPFPDPCFFELLLRVQPR